MKKLFGKAILVSALTVAGVLAASSAAEAQVISKSKEGASSGGELGLPLTLGSGFEFQNDAEAKEYAFPVTLEYNFTETFKLVMEASYVRIQSKDPAVKSASGMGDLETFLEWEFIPERRYRPALTAEFGVKWPTAPHPDLGTGKADYVLGLIASKEIDHWKFDLGAVYTWAGSPRALHVRNTFELSIAAEWEVSHIFDIEAELLWSKGGGARFSGQSGSVGGFAGASRLLGGGGSEYELSLGVAVHLSRYVKVEVGGVIQPDGSWQAIVFWELDFSGEN